MLNVGAIEEGFVLDHIKAGKAMTIYKDLKLDQLDCTVAIIKNAKSSKMGKKDIIKIDSDFDVDTDILGFVDPDVTVNIIKDGKIAEKKTIGLPERLNNVLICKNPRCISATEQELPQIFKLTDSERRIYRCIYCETKAKNSVL